MKFVAGQACKVRVDIYDTKGMSIVPSSVTFSIFDADDVALVTNSVFPGSIGNTYVDIDVDATINETPESKDVRRVEVTATLDSGSTTVQSQTYIIEAGVSLVVSDNSFQTFQSAIMNADEIPNTMGFDGAEDGERIAALKQAYINIAALRYEYTTANSMTRIGGKLNITYLNEYTLEEFLELPKDFIKALRKAQVAEADSILGGDPVEDLRQSGIMSKTVGESSQMFRPGAPMKLPLSRPAFEMLKKYIRRNNVMGRG